jgi:hypothetical protein
LQNACMRFCGFSLFANQFTTTYGRDRAIDALGLFNQLKRLILVQSTRSLTPN